MEIKEILLEAAKLMESGYSRWMCITIKHILEPNRIPCYVEIPKEFADYGFNRENYSSFVKKNYPELEKYLLRVIGNYSNPWINTVMDDDPETLFRIIDSKIEFLKYLANEGKTAKETSQEVL